MRNALNLFLSLKTCTPASTLNHLQKKKSFTVRTRPGFRKSQYGYIEQLLNLLPSRFNSFGKELMELCYIKAGSVAAEALIVCPCVQRLEIV